MSEPIPLLSPGLAWSILVAIGVVLGLLVPLAIHRTVLVNRWHRSRDTAPGFPPRSHGPWPSITVQLPVYNEPRVVERLLDAACSLDYPRESLEVQLLDDSTDGSHGVAAARVRYWREQGVDVKHLRRPLRTGFKAGALAFGLERAKGEFLLILDADFVPSPDLLKALLPPFQDAAVGMVQARWDHLNENENPLTRAQALMLDAHFVFEHGGRQAAGCFFNFNGTAGMWRRSAIQDAGGWSAETLTEDLDLSYRAQLKGWRFVYLDDVRVPAELPAGVTALEGQQRRWAQGGIQTGVKLLPRIFRSPLPARMKLEALIHMGGHMAHPLTLILGFLLFPSALARQALGLEKLLFLDMVAFSAATLPFLLFYWFAGRTRGRRAGEIVPAVPITIAVGIGLTASVSLAVVRGLVGKRDPFIRTPKVGSSPAGAARSAGLLLGERGSAFNMKGVLTLYHLGTVLLGAWMGFYGSIPFYLLFACGYGGLWWGEWRSKPPAPSSSPKPVGNPSRAHA
ncbi:MAG: glycosyltransferase [Gemmatimonadota bacterium]